MRNFIEIDGVKWATRNIGNSGEFVANPEDYGKLYTWEEAQRACPKGWRLPTKEELESLIDVSSVWTTRNGVKGRLFGTAPNQIFLPAADYRRIGVFDYIDDRGCYWSSTQDDTSHAMHLGFVSGGSLMLASLRFAGFSVRCVAED